MSTSKLLIYNNALQLLGERRLSNLYEDREPRYVLDEAYSLELVNHCLEVAKPRFSVSSAKLASPAASTVHGLDSVYTFPADYVSTLIDPGVHGNNGSFFADEDFSQPVDRYIIEGNTVATDIATNLWMRYISSSRSLSLWTPVFGRLVAAYLAKEIASRINPSRIEIAEAAYEKALSIALELEGIKENDVVPQAAAASLSTDQLAIYNRTAAALGQAEFRHIDDGSSLRLAIDSVYDIATDTCLELIKPRFAALSAELGSPSTSSVHSLDEVYALPADYISLLPDAGVHGVNASVFADAGFENPVDRYIIEGRTIATNISTNLYLRYISNGEAEASWTPLFREAVALYAASLLARRFNPEAAEAIANDWTVASAAAQSREGVKENAPLPQVAAASLSTDQLAIYNATASLLGRAEFRHIDDESGLRLAIDALYSLAEDDLLETIKPKFATRVAALTGGATSAVHDYDNVFSLPADFKNICELWADDTLQTPITRYFLENTDIAIDGFATAYIRYIIGTTVESAWSPSFKKAMAAYLAYELAPRFAPERSGDIGQILERRIGVAVAVDGAKEPAFRPVVSTYTLDNEIRKLYNKALQILKLQPIVTNTDESERKVALDYAMNQKAVETVFELVSWGFLYKSVKLSNDDSVDPEWAYDYAFAVPSDFIRIDKISADEYFRYPAEYLREGSYFFADTDEIYLRYLSNDQFTTLTTWPVYVFNLVAAELARSCGTLPGADLQNAEAKYEEYKSEAFSTDAQRNPPEVISDGNWIRSRITWPMRRTQRP